MPRISPLPKNNPGEQQLCIQMVTAINDLNVWMNGMVWRIELFCNSECYLLKKSNYIAVFPSFVLVIMSGWTFLTVVIQYEQAFCLRRLYWYVCSRITIVWRHEGTSHATSCHSVVTSAWWYNILYSIEIFGFNHSMQPIWYKTLYQNLVLEICVMQDLY
jgi:hypothetical protein